MAVQFHNKRRLAFMLTRWLLSASELIWESEQLFISSEISWFYKFKFKVYHISKSEMESTDISSTALKDQNNSSDAPIEEAPTAKNASKQAQQL